MLEKKISQTETPQKIVKHGFYIKTPPKSPILKNYITKTLDLSSTSSPQINKTMYNSLETSKRIRVLQIACESPDVLTQFFKRKLFTTSKDSKSIFMQKKKKKAQDDKVNNTNIWKTPTKKEIFSKLEASKKFSTDPTREAIFRLKIDGKKESPKARTEKSREIRCCVVANIVKNCESLRNSSRSTEKLNLSIGKEKNSLKNINEKLKWTTGRLTKWADFQEPILKELMDQENFTRMNETSDRLQLSKELSRKTVYEARDQARFIKKILKRHRERLL